MKVAVHQKALACGPQANLERKTVRTRSQVAKALLLEQSMEGASNGVPASQAGTTKLASPRPPQEVQPKPRPPQEVLLEPQQRPLQEVQPKPEPRPQQEFQPKPQRRPKQKVLPKPKPRPPQEVQLEPQQRPLQEVQPKPKRRPQKEVQSKPQRRPQQEVQPKPKPRPLQEVQLEPQQRPQQEVQPKPQQRVEPRPPQEVQLEPELEPEQRPPQEVQLEPELEPEERPPQEVQLEPELEPEQRLPEEVQLEPELEPEQWPPQEVQPQLEPEPRPPQEVQPEIEQRPLQGWETEFQEFLEAEEAAWEEQLLMEVNPWANTATFLASFEQVALACRWPRREWVTRLLPALSDEAETALVSLDTKDRGDFQKVKMAILRREALGRERKRQEFRRFCYQEANGPGEVCTRLWELCHQWLKVEHSTKDQVLELLVLEQFMNVLPKEMQNWVKEHSPDTCAQAVALADDFLRMLAAADQELEVVTGSPPKREWTQLKVAPMQVQAKLDIKDSPITLQKTYPAGYQKARANQKKNMQGRPRKDVKLQMKFPERVNTVLPQLLKQEGATEDRRQSKRLRKSCPATACEAPSSPPKKICKKLEKPSQSQEAIPDLKTCAECGQLFNGLASFMRHRIVHTGEKRYECCFCGKGFCWRSDLVRHECIHTGKMPHECTYCGQGFDRKWKRKQHEEEHLKSKALI